MVTSRRPHRGRPTVRANGQARCSPVDGNWPDLSKATTPYNRYYLPFNSLSTDFRSLQATVIDKGLGADHTKILGSTHPLIGFL